MTTNRFTSFAAAASAATLMLAAPAPAAELVFGSWTPAQEYQNRVAMPELIKNIDKDTNGAIKWKLIAGGQIADGKTTFTAVKDGLMQAGLGIVTYVPNAIPSLYAIYSTIIFGESDPVAASLAASETHLSQVPVLPRGVQGLQRRPDQRLDQLVLCAGLPRADPDPGRPQGQAHPRHRRQRRNVQAGRRGPGRRHAGRGGRPAAARRPRLPARHLRLAAHLRLRRRRQIRHGLSARPDRAGDRHVHEPRHLEGLHARAEEGPHQACGLAERQDGDRELRRRPTRKRSTPSSRTRACRWSRSATPSIPIPPNYKKAQREANIATAKSFGVKDPAPIIDYYEQAVERWRPASKEIGRDIDKFADVLNREVYSKIDPDKL